EAKLFAMCRYLVISRIGGVFADSNLACLKPIDSWLSNESLAFGCSENKILGPGVSSAVIVSVPNHPFWESIDVDLKRNYHMKFNTADGRDEFLSNRTFEAVRFLPERALPLLISQELIIPIEKGE